MGSILSLNAKEDEGLAPEGMRALSVSLKVHENVPVDKQIRVEHLSRLTPFLNDYLIFADEYRFGAGHAVLPLDVILKRPRSKEGTPLFCRTSKKNVFVLIDAQETPLQVIAAVQRFVEKFA